ncbi:hypothetical protein EIN_475870 [Entamoeba invadens IP1]|uniref:Uncharacterized protein n=1 Tax=Entamoeba invadens IP1 TaxID=370355 RepID=A0A0A1U9T1_ENTIV|nr:hypothetical protein EIN_475870 [Entamoeba invadens IP1]ELP88885.1 hypothetical protein EIN_475870 [Entamoeba invadens IP1]|eukprot:XP_004255656.1 hypothetical protein EIN_475870 [Entamoeba invadens IP1]
MTEKTFQVVVIGEGSVGKSAICLLYVKGEFNVEYNPTIEDSYAAEVDVEGQKVKMSLIDTTGQEEYISLREQYYLKGDAFVLVYSIDNKNSFHALKNHRDGILGFRTGKKTLLVMAGNKCDLEEQRQIPTDEAKKQAEEWGNIPFFETSAQNNINIKELFGCVAKLLMDAAKEENAHKPADQKVEEKKTEDPKEVTQTTSEAKSGCCVLF